MLEAPSACQLSRSPSVSDAVGALTSLSFPALTTVGGALLLSYEASLAEGVPAKEGFDALVSIGGGLTVEHTSLTSLFSYFPALTQVGAGTLSATFNSELDCDDVELLYCKVEQPLSGSVASNLGGCSWGTPNPSCD